MNDNLATLLAAQAQVEQVSLEQWALSILGHAAEHPRELQTWTSLNQRRFALISKRYSAGLDQLEEREFAHLQETVARLLEPWDRAMIENNKIFVKGIFDYGRR
ncbi:MAG: hypothetical protein ACREEM_54175 [Blastocatellia bacterium]